MRAKCARARAAQVLLPRVSQASEKLVTTDPAECAVRQHRSTRDALTVANLFVIAGMIEPDPELVHDWYHATSIVALDGLTAEVLVAQGRAGDVLGFLLAMLDHGG